jgi:hypothetical protein
VQGGGPGARVLEKPRCGVWVIRSLQGGIGKKGNHGRNPGGKGSGQGEVCEEMGGVWTAGVGACHRGQDSGWAGDGISIVPGDLWLSSISDCSLELGSRCGCICPPFQLLQVAPFPPTPFSGESLHRPFSYLISLTS